MSVKKSAKDISTGIRNRASSWLLTKRKLATVETMKEAVIAEFLSRVGDDSVDEVKKTFYTEPIDELIDERGPGLSGVKYLILLSGDEASAKKAALYAISQRARNISDDSDDNFFYSDDGSFDLDYDEVDEMTIKNDLSKDDVRQVCLRDKSELPVMNPYIAHLIGGFPNEVGIFYGIDSSDDLEKKLEMIRAAKLNFAVLIASEMMGDSPEIRSFIAEGDCEVCLLDSPEEGYYTAFIKDMFKGSGAQLPDDATLTRIVRELKNVYRRHFGEEQLVYHCLKAAQSGNMTLTYRDFTGGDEGKSAIEELEKLIGLSNVKEIIKDAVALALEQGRNPALTDIHKSMVFVGAPGTGKTTVAELVARIYKDIGVGNGAFVRADRSSLIGKFVGHTSPMVKKKFDEARGGVLFVDEAGFFTQSGTGGYVNEAIKEFVRYMENYPDVTVIFAMYDSEAEDFMKLDAGLRSRIANVVKFEDYSCAQLLEIVVYMLTKRGYKLGKAQQQLVKEYLEGVGSSFGNARGARKLCEAMIVERSRRLMDSDEKEVRDMAMSSSDVKGAISRMKKSRVARRSVGFSIGAGVDTRLKTASVF